MSKVKDLHARAMEHAERAFLARLRGNTDVATDLFREALKGEIAAIEEMREYSEPTHSILHRSAATLALDCHDLRTAERMAAQGLAKDPPVDLAQELRDVLEQIHFRRHLDLRGIELSEDELQMNLTGPAVGFGLVNSNEFLSRVGDLSRLIHRTVERKKRKPFREKGRSGKDIEDNYELFISVPRAASFSVTLRLGSPIGQQSFPVVRDIPAIVDEFLDLLALANKSKIVEIRDRIPEPAYFRNFLGLAKKLAPDGARIRQVGFTAVRKGEQRHVSVTRHSDQFGELRTDEPPTGELKSIVIRGALRYADSTRSSSNKIKLIDDEERSHVIRVPEGMMGDIVRPMWEARVEIRGRRDGRHIVLESIEEIAPTDTSDEGGTGGQE